MVWRLQSRPKTILIAFSCTIKNAWITGLWALFTAFTFNNLTSTPDFSTFGSLVPEVAVFVPTVKVYLRN